MLLSRCRSRSGASCAKEQRGAVATHENVEPRASQMAGVQGRRQCRLVVQPSPPRVDLRRRALNSQLLWSMAKAKSGSGRLSTTTTTLAGMNSQSNCPSSSSQRSPRSSDPASPRSCRPSLSLCTLPETTVLSRSKGESVWGVQVGVDGDIVACGEELVEADVAGGGDR